MTAGHRPIFLLCGVKIFFGSARSAKPVVMGIFRGQICRSIKDCRNGASPLRVYYTFERLGSAGGRTRCNPGAQPPGHLPASVSVPEGPGARGTTPVTPRPVRGGLAALIAARRA